MNKNRAVPLIKRIFVLSLLAMLLLNGVAMAAPAVPDIPAQARAVNDFGNMLHRDDVQEMESIAHALKKASGAELVVVTVNDLGGYTIEDYSLELFRKWGLGDKEKNNGVLLLVNKENVLAGRSGRVRVEVGYGLEGAIPDGKAGRILDDYVLPPWDNNDFNLGVYQGFMALASAIAEEYDMDISETGELAVLEDYQSGGQGTGISAAGIIAVVILILIIGFINNRIARKMPRRRYPFDNRGGPFSGGGGFGGFSGGGGGFGGFGGGSSGGGGASR